MPAKRFLIAIAISCCATVPAAAQSPITYSRDIRPILAANCFACHGPDEGARKAELRLDTRAGAIADRDGSRAVVPGDTAASALIERLVTDDEDLRMPPKDSGKKVSAEQIELLKKWIAAGADYERHWAFDPISKPAPPTTESTLAARAPIDSFIFERLARNQLAPSPEADRHTLIRRVYLDLLGLATGSDEASEFAASEQPDAYERIVDRALADPAYGERWGRHWLDQARYADSHGYTNDNERTMWPYRDWVIRAINRDLPFDQFTIEQLAGDLLPAAKLEQTIATGFHRNTLINTEGGVKADQFRDEQVKDRVDTTGLVWLGLTVGCAQCHSHKYDPISQAEYYQLYAFFNSTADNNSVPPIVQAPTPRQESRLRQLDTTIENLQAQIAADSDRRNRQDAWQRALVGRQRTLRAPEPTADDEWTVLEVDGKSDAGASFAPLPDRSLLVSGENLDGDLYQLTARSPLRTVRSVRLDVLTDKSLPRRGPGRADNGNFILSEFWFTTGDGRELRFARAHADHSQPKYDVSAAIDNNEDTGWAVNGSPEGGPNHNRTAWFVLAEPLAIEDDISLNFNMQHRKGSARYNIGRFRVSISSDEWVDAPAEGELASLAAIAPAKRTAKQQSRLDEAFLRSDARLGPIHSQLQRADAERQELNRQVATTMVLRELDQPRKTHLQVRGDFLKPGDEVTTNVPSVLPPATKSARLSRLDFAKWLVRSDNPLSPRVRVNRIWMRLFGAGLVETENDFGTQGTLPTHPELLDWLAREHVESGWSTKHLIRQVLNSAAYRQSSHSIEKNTATDPRNLLLWRQNRMRVEGEIIRDLALSASGLLCRTVGGQSVYPPQADGVYAFTQRAKTWRTSEGEDRYRRGMYTFYYRSAPHPMLSTFDAPAFNLACTRRDRSNTPLQSLTVANDAAMVETAQALARGVVAQTAQSPVAKTIEQLFRACLVRSPTAAELAYLERYLQTQREHFTARPDEAKAAAPGVFSTSPEIAEAAAWVATARVLLNLDEFITRE